MTSRKRLDCFGYVKAVLQNILPFAFIYKIVLQFYCKVLGILYFDVSFGFLDWVKSNKKVVFVTVNVNLFRCLAFKILQHWSKLVLRKTTKLLSILTDNTLETTGKFKF